ncbi:MAG: glycine zipper domain-containing protein [Candidatus Methylomirabilales bacterium]
MRNFLSVIALVAMLSACAQRPLSTREQGALTGAGLGAGAGALIGSASGNAGTGAAVGAGLGLLSGALIGGAIENQRGETANPPPAAGSFNRSAAHQSVQPQANVGIPTTVTVDPTRGQFVNGTQWRLEVFIDADPQAVQNGGGIALNPQETRQHSMDLGAHRVIARAHVDTQFGTRTVGRYDRTIQVDPRASGWTLRFSEADFR